MQARAICFRAAPLQGFFRIKCANSCTKCKDFRHFAFFCGNFLHVTIMPSLFVHTMFTFSFDLIYFLKRLIFAQYSTICLFFYVSLILVSKNKKSCQTFAAQSRQAGYTHSLYSQERLSIPLPQRDGGRYEPLVGRRAQKRNAAQRQNAPLGSRLFTKQKNRAPKTGARNFFNKSSRSDRLM